MCNAGLWWSVSLMKANEWEWQKYAYAYAPPKVTPPNNKGFQKAPLGGHLRGGLAEHPFREGACNCNMFTPCDLDWMVGVKNDTLRLLDAPFALAR